MTDLQPCPFCGQRPHIEVIGLGAFYREFTVYCETESDRCRSIPDVDWTCYEDQAIEQWNDIVSCVFH